jgi:hypothetical protein
MPCWDSNLYAKEFKENQCAKHQEECSEIKHLESRIHNLTRMLCSLCKKVESAWPSVFLENTDLSAWWKDHKANDQVIKELEEVRSLKNQINEIEQRISLALKTKNQPLERII